MSNHRLCSVIVALAAICAVPAAEAKSVRISRIPSGQLAKLPGSAAVPKSIPSRSRVDGIVAIRPTRHHHAAEAMMAFVAPNKALAESLSRGDFGARDEEGPQHCFTAVAPFATRGRGGEDFPTEQNHMQQLWAEPKSADRVWVVRSERFVRGSDDEATLEVVDAYVDAVSLGARLISRSTVALRRIASGPRDVDVYAARDHDKVHFIVTAPDASILPAGIRDVARSLRSATTEDSGFSQCAFLRTSMQADGGGRAATVFVQVPIEIDEMQLGASGPGQRGLGGPSPARTVREAVIREATVHLSVSRTSSDRSPVVSIGFGWEGESQRIPV